MQAARSSWPPGGRRIARAGWGGILGGRGLVAVLALGFCPGLGCYALPFVPPTPPANPYASYVPFIPMPTTGTYWQPVGPIVSAFPQPAMAAAVAPAPAPAPVADLPVASANSAAEPAADAEPNPPGFVGKHGAP